MIGFGSLREMSLDGTECGCWILFLTIWLRLSSFNLEYPWLGHVWKDPNIAISSSPSHLHHKAEGAIDFPDELESFISHTHEWIAYGVGGIEPNNGDREENAHPLQKIQLI